MLAAIKAPTTEQGDASREVGTIWSVRIAAFLTV